MPTMVDLFAGLGGASQAMKDRGWTVYRVELNEAQRPDVVADVRHLPIQLNGVDLLWASPPCTEYSRIDQPWFKNPPAPSTELWEAAERAILQLEPRFWIIENTRGARKIHGKDSRRYGSNYLWGNLPLWPVADIARCHERTTGAKGSNGPARRGMIPYDLSMVIALAVESFVSKE